MVAHRLRIGGVDRDRGTAHPVGDLGMLGEELGVEVGRGRVDLTQPLVERDIGGDAGRGLVEGVSAHVLDLADDRAGLFRKAVVAQGLLRVLDGRVGDLDPLRLDLLVDDGPVDQPREDTASGFGLGQILLVVSGYGSADEGEEPVVGGEGLDVGLEDLGAAHRRDRLVVVRGAVTIIGAGGDDSDEQEAHRDAHLHGPNQMLRLTGHRAMVRRAGTAPSNK